MARLVLVISFNNDKKETFIINEDIIEILIHNFADGKTLTEVREDHEDLDLMIEHKRATNGENSRRLVALHVIAHFQLKLVLEKLAETPDKPADSAVSTK